MSELNFTGAGETPAAETPSPAATPPAQATPATPAATPAANPWMVEHTGRDGTVTKLEVPEPFRGADGTVNVAAVLKAHNDLRGQLSTRPTAPEKYDFAALIPEETKPLLGDVLVADAPLLPKAEAFGKKWNLPPEAMAEALGLLAERDGLLGQATEADSTRAQEQAWEEAVALVGSKEKAEGIGRRFAAVLGLSASDSIGIPPKALPKLEELLNKAGAGTVPSARDAAPAGNVTEADLQSMMQDPRYWKQKDPAFIAKVTDGYRRLYGNGQQ